MTRMVLQTFFGEYRGHGHPHESPRHDDRPARRSSRRRRCSSGSSARRRPARRSSTGCSSRSPRRSRSCHGSPPCRSPPRSSASLGGYAVYRRWRERDPIRVARPGVHAALRTSTTSTTSTGRASSGPIRDDLAAVVYWTNQNVLDGIVNGAAAAHEGVRRAALRRSTSDVIDGAVNGLGRTAGFTGGLLRYLQSGNVQRYAAFLFAGVVDPGRHLHEDLI